jgi:hypothetical protein
MVLSSFMIDHRICNETLGSVSSLLAQTLYLGNPDMYHRLWNIVSTERYILHMQVLLECCYISMERSQLEN